MSFAWPGVLLGLLLVPLVGAAYVLVQRRRARYAVRFTNLDLLAAVVQRAPGWRRHVPPALLLLALAALLVGLARPEVTVRKPREEGTVVLTTDVSGSMTATDVRPDRLTAARSAAKTFVRVLPPRFRTSLVTFSSVAQVVAPPTTDRRVVASALDTLQASGGTAMGSAIERALQAAQLPGDGLRAQVPASPGGATGGARRRGEPPAVILMLSDGANTEGPDPVGVAAEAKRLRVPIYTIALGTSAGVVQEPDGTTVPVPPDDATLRRIAEDTGGRFFRAPDEEDLRAIYEDLGSRFGFIAEKREVTVAFVAGGVVLLLAASGLSLLWFGRLP